MRIEVYTQRPLADCFYFLREAPPGPEHFKSHENVYVIAEEIAEEIDGGRWWFVVGPQGLSDGFFSSWFPPHVVVDAQSIKPGEASEPFRNWVKREVRPPTQTELAQLRQQRLDRKAAEVRHTLYCQQVVQDRAKLAEQAARIKQLEAELSAAAIEDSAPQPASVSSQPQQVPAETFTTRAKAWFRKHARRTT